MVYRKDTIGNETSANAIQPNKSITKYVFREDVAAALTKFSTEIWNLLNIKHMWPVCTYMSTYITNNV